MQRTA